ncbi:MAG: hypothetical protein RIQ71_1560 [Verrucomicrobiota bacterium]|jgi:hypothetical protein
MKAYTRTLLGLALGLAASPALKAGSIAEWTFDDPANTSLKSAANSGSAGGAWMHNFDATTTDGSGKLVSRKPSGGIWNTYLTLPADAPRKVWLVVDLAGWNMSGEKIKEAVRAGFSASDDDNKPQVVAQVVLERMPGGVVAVRGDALGDGATAVSGDASSLQQTSTTPVTLVVGLDQDAGTYSVSTRTAEGGMKQLGSGKTSPSRAAKFVRFSIAGDLSGSDEQVTVDRIAVTDAEPSSH